MITSIEIMKRIVKLGLLLLVVMSMSACTGLIPRSMSWKEEVKLQDGQIIVVDRHYKLGGYPAIESRERAALNQTVTFRLPGTNKKIIWQTDFRDSQPEPNSLGALLLDVVDGVPYLATSPAGCIAYNKWGRPNPPYVLYKYVNDEWQRISMKEFPAVLVHANLIGKPASSLLKSYYTVGEAKAQRENGNISDYAKTILREPVERERCPQYSSGPKAPVPITPSTSPK